MKRVYFILRRCAGNALIKIGATGDCPYLRLDQLRRVQRKHAPYDRFELLGVLDGLSVDKAEIQEQFSSFREDGDWFRPGYKLLKYIFENSKPHFCKRACPDGTIVYEERRQDEETASDYFAKALSGIFV